MQIPIVGACAFGLCMPLSISNFRFCVNTGVLAALTPFSLETVFDRSKFSSTFTAHDYLTLLKPHSVQGYHLDSRGIYRPFLILRHPPILILWVYYSSSFVFSNILLTLIFASLFCTIYGFSPGLIGLCLGVPLLVGNIIRHFARGPLSSISLNRSSTHKPEARLGALWLPFVIFPVPATTAL